MRSGLRREPIPRFCALLMVVAEGIPHGVGRPAIFGGNGALGCRPDYDDEALKDRTLAAAQLDRRDTDDMVRGNLGALGRPGRSRRAGSGAAPTIFHRSHHTTMDDSTPRAWEGSRRMLSCHESGQGGLAPPGQSEVPLALWNLRSNLSKLTKRL